ncbi:ABC transporter substrate-binding protein [Streptomyces sp. NPDC057287]|uniref:ABC transporter substrate-binding protein n=1 Tax=Streptomyces sp. NPDC057287 TaxID=3346086 RepID=UPI00362E0283
MSTGTDRKSPLLGARDLAAGGPLPNPAPHTEEELAALVSLLLRKAKHGTGTVAVGHSRDAASRAAAGAFAATWRARGGTVLATVDWPETAASWLRPATRLTAEPPDAWVMAAALPGFVQLARRLRHSTEWDPARTCAFASLQDPRLPGLAGPGAVDGLSGATAEGGTWEVRRHRITVHPPEQVAP